MDVDDLPVNGGRCKDVAKVQVRTGEDTVALELMMHWSHLVHPSNVFYFPDESDEEGTEEAPTEEPDENDNQAEKSEQAKEEVKEAPPYRKEMIFPETAEESKSRLAVALADGTDAGFLIWDSSVMIADILLSSDRFKCSLKGKRVLELGCGLGLPGFVSGTY